MADEQKPKAVAAALLHEQSDAMLGCALGRDLMGATVRIVLGLAVIAVILATIAAIAR